MPGNLLSFQASTLIAYQIGFDLYENASQQILSAITNSLKQISPAPIGDPDVQVGDKKSTDDSK